MGRKINFLGSGKAITATTAQQLSFTGNDLPSAGVVAFHFMTSGGANNSFANVCTRIRVRADNNVIWDCNALHFRTLMQRMSQANYPLATSALQWSIWFNMLDIIDDDAADTCQFPQGSVPSVEFTTNASVAAGSLYAGWSYNPDVKAEFYSRFVGQPMQIATGTNLTFPIQESGAIRAAVVDTPGLDRLRLELNGEQVIHAPGPLYIATASGNMLQETGQIEDGTTVTGATAIRIPGRSASQGGSRIELTTGSGWGGTTNELSLWSVSPQRAA
jgi:hypothetical protein